MRMRSMMMTMMMLTMERDNDHDAEDDDRDGDRGDDDKGAAQRRTVGEGHNWATAMTGLSDDAQDGDEQL